ncbi:MAG: ATP-binding protein, partial [Acidimicrobiaceae bacterium]
GGEGGEKGRSRATGGNGLGLSIVRHIVLEQGGSIDVRSEEGIGSTFMVRLPRVKRQIKEPVSGETRAMV